VRRVRDAGLDGLAGNAYCTLAFGAVLNRRHAEAQSHIDAGADYCSEHDLDGWRPFLLAMRAELELEQGRWSDAVDSAALVLAGVAGELRTGHGFGPGTVFALAVLGRVRARRGDPDAWTPLGEALALAEASGQLLRLRPVAAARAEAAWLEGRAELVPDELDSTFDLAVRRRDRWAMGQLAFWRWRSGIEEEMPAGAAEPFAAQVAGGVESGRGPVGGARLSVRARAGAGRLR